jgi:hypothetical protein
MVYDWLHMCYEGKWNIGSSSGHNWKMAVVNGSE